MTVRKTPRPRSEMLGGFEKKCLHCGTPIHRKDEDNMRWLRRSYCNKACKFADISKTRMLR
jgi:endogenous inhibitor of DNA gyrase (YacG/DUF329 family)